MVIDAKIAVSALRAIADKKLGHLIGGYGPGAVILICGIFLRIRPESCDD
jgi:hypothetical protein